MSDAELIALSILVQREGLAMDWENKQREAQGLSMAYDDDNANTDLYQALYREMQKRGYLISY